MSISARISSKLNPVRLTALDVNRRFDTHGKSFSDCFRVVLIPSVVAFGVTTMLWLKDDKRSVCGWRVLAHLGPYQVPSLVASRGWERALDSLGRADELGLMESEIGQLLTDIEVVTQRRQAVREIVAQYGFEVFRPVFVNLSSGDINGQSHFESNLRVAMDIVCATPAKDRRVPIDTLEKLVSRNKKAWESRSNEEVMRFREYRAVLLLKLLQNKDNAVEAKDSKIIAEFLASEQAEAQHVKFSTLPLIPVLYQFKTDKLGYEYSDILWRIEDLRGSSADPSPNRISLSLERKLDFQNFEKMIYLTLCYSSLRILPLISEYSVVVLKNAGSVMLRSVMGVCLLDAVYRTEEHVIQSKPFYDNNTKSRFLLSACMVLAHSAAGGTVLRSFPYCFAPFALMRLRDSFSDSFRFV
jgi:hypothetical protein